MGRGLKVLIAIAVVAVIRYHAFPETIPGGFVVVDVFFVVSSFFDFILFI